MRVFISGFGMVSAIGMDKAEHLEALRDGKSGVGKAAYVQTRYTNQMPFGEVKCTDAQLRNKIKFNLPDSATRTELLAFVALEEAIRQSGCSETQISDFRTSLVSASTVGGMCMTDELYDDANQKKEKSPFVSSYGPAAHTMRLATFYNIKGYTDTINTACSSSANAIMMGMKLIQNDMADRVIVGGTDSLAKFTINGFNALQILSEKPCRPFDADRDGLNLGEGAAYLILESEKVMQGKALGEVIGYGNSNDAYHPSALSDDAVGVVKAMGDALEKANMNPEEISYVNAHGTATPNNDQVEYTGLQKIFETIPPYNSTKSYTGHTLAAAGALEACIGLLSMENNMIFPGLNFKQKLDADQVVPVTALTRTPVSTVMSNSFGFAGNCTSIILKQP